MSSYPPPPTEVHYTPAYFGSLATPDGSETAFHTPSNTYTGPTLPGVTDLDSVVSRVEHPMYAVAQELHTSVVSDQATVSPEPSDTPHSGDSPHKKSTKSAPRLRKACDSCSVRKVKCDESGPPCKACAALDIPCTFSRPTKRRGPPNRHAQALKRQRLDGQPLDTEVSPSDAAQVLTALSAQSSEVHVSAESICPLETLDLLIDDFFTYLHPLCPFPHEPSFREAWQQREDLTNTRFLALLASMIGALVASFPRKPRLQLKAQRKDKLYPNHMAMVQQCHRVCTQARGPFYLESDDLNVYDAATSYFLALMGMYTLRYRQGRMYFGECLIMLRVLDLHRTDSAISERSRDTPDDGLREPRDCITQQMGFRLFWTAFVGSKTLQQLAMQYDELYIPPSTSTSPYPPLPLEIDDIYIFPDRIGTQPPGLLPIIAGFNANVKAFLSYDTLSTTEVAWGINNVVDWERQKRVLREALHKCRDSTASLPPELQVDLQPRPSENGAHFYSTPDSNVMPARSLLSLAGVHNEDLMHQTPQQRRNMQYEIQKANIHASSLSTRSYIVQKYWNLVEVHARLRTQHTPISRPDTPHSPTVSIVAAGLDGVLPKKPAPTSNFNLMDQEFQDERETIIKDLLVVLGSIDQVSMEPNGNSFKLKIRSIASTLLDAPASIKGHMDLQVKEYLAIFLEILVKLDQVHTSDDTRQDEEAAAELQHWADLREHRMKLAQSSL